MYNNEKLSFSNRDQGVGPLITTTWDQSWAYNYYCPEDPAGPGGHTYAGCGATMMAQILYYWRWPDHGQGDHCYTPQIHPEYGEQCADFENTWYRWDEMIDQPLSQPIATAIAELLYHLGVSLDMDYNTVGGSAPILGYYAPFLPEYFRFNSSYENIYRDSVDLVFFRENLRDELNQQKPVPYAGASDNYSSIHAFVCDGYQDSLYFHFNLGWSGNSDGYYLIDQVLGYSFHQYYISGLLPDTTANVYPIYENGADTLNSIQGSITDGSGPIHNYLNNTLASWLIDPQTEEDSVTNITLEIKRLDLFDDADRLYIYDGEDDSAPLLAELSGSDLPETINSNGNKVFVEFISDNENTAEGFYIVYLANQPDFCTETSYLTELSGVFGDGSMNFNYYNSTMCQWYLMPETDQPLTLYFNYFDTEEGHDFVEIYDLETQGLLVKLSGNYETPPDPVTAESGQMLVAFMSNNDINAGGWEAWYDLATTVDEANMEVSLTIAPNPVNHATTISYCITQTTDVSIYLFDAMGMKIKELHVGQQDSGIHKYDMEMANLPPGVYFVQLQANPQKVTRKVVKL
jgi:hypothetical protein